MEWSKVGKEAVRVGKISNFGFPVEVACGKLAGTIGNYLSSADPWKHLPFFQADEKRKPWTTRKTETHSPALYVPTASPLQWALPYWPYLIRQHLSWSLVLPSLPTTIKRFQILAMVPIGCRDQRMDRKCVGIFCSHLSLFHMHTYRSLENVVRRLNDIEVDRTLPHSNPMGSNGSWTLIHSLI